MATPDLTSGRGARGAWSMVDQGLSSLSNMAVSVAVARAVGVHELGGFSVAYVVYTMLLGLTRALTSEPLTVRHSATDPADLRPAIAEVTGTALAIGVVWAAPLLAIAALSPSAIGGPLVALAIFLPGLLVQDVWRFAFVTCGQPRSAAANDLVWLVVQGLVFAVVPRLADPSGGAYLAAWGAAATVAAVAGCVQSGVVPAPTRALAWLRAHAAPARAFTFEFVARAGARQMTISVAGATAGLAALGALRGGQVVFGPLNVILLGASMAAIPEAVRSLRSNDSALVPFCDRLVIGLVLLCVGYSAAATAVPAALGRSLLGATWPGAHTLFVSQGALLVGIAASSGYLVGLRARQDLRSSVLTRAALIPVTVLGGVTGAVIDGARGLLLGLSAANIAGAVLFRRRLVHAVSMERTVVMTRAPADSPGPTPRPLSPGP